MRRALLAVTALVVVVAVAGCGEEPVTAEPSSGDSVNLTFEGGEAPSLERVEVGVGEEVELVVRADEAGTLHVHTSPEQELEYGPGTTTLKLSIDQPGVVDVESHELEATVLQLEVS